MSVGVKAAKKQFPELYSEYGNLVRVCREMGIHDRDTVYKWRDRDQAFREAFDEAKEAAALFLEDVAYQRAVEGVPKGVYYQGNKVDTELEYDHGLLTTLLKANAPKKFRDNSNLEVTGLQPTVINVGIDLKVLTVEQLRAARDIALALEQEVK